MFKNGNSKFLFFFDLIIIYACFLMVFVHYNGWKPVSFNAIILMILIGIVWPFITVYSNNAQIYSTSRMYDLFRNIFVSYSMLSAIIISIVAILGNFRPNDKLILYPLLYASFLSSIIRLAYLIVLKISIRRGYFQKSLLLIGGDRVAEKVMQKVLSSPELGYRLIGVLADYYHKTLSKELYLGKIDIFSEIVKTKKVDEVIIALPLRREKSIIDIVEKCEHEGLRFRIVPDFFRIIRNRPVLNELDDIPLISIRTEPLNLFRNRFIKRMFDIIFSLMVLIFLSPLFILLILIIKLTSPGPVFFKQKRIGVNNVEFYLYKFRSMVLQEVKLTDTTWTTPNDSRVTRIGKFIRKTNFDELPQFWNVLIGNMSVVGPRPEREYFVNKFKKDILNYKVRHLVKSGITGWAQVCGWRGDTDISKRIECDIHYVENWSFWLDLKIIWLTLFGNNTNKCAY